MSDHHHDHPWQTIHSHHQGWDNTITPVQRIAAGETLSFNILDASGGQIKPSSSLSDYWR